MLKYIFFLSNLIKAIQQNPEAFLQLIQGGRGEEEGEEEEGQAQYINITPEEDEAINRVTPS